MKPMKTTIRIFVLTMAASMLFAAAVAAQPIPSDVITVGTRTGAPGGTVDVPVYIRDTASTPLGIDQPPGSRIQSYSIRVLYAPASAVQSITFTRGGITQPLTPTFENSPAVPGVSISLLGNFDEATNLIPFTSNAALPGDQVATLHVTIAPNAPPGTNITLALDPVLTQLTDEGGTPATVETVANGRLTLVDGALIVTSPIPTLSTWAALLLIGVIAVVAVRFRMF
jgi:hypothetical protein